MSIVLDGTLGITTPSETNTGTLSVTGVTTLTGGLNAALPVLSGGTGVTTSTGTGAVVLGTSPTLVAPALGTPASGVLTNCTGVSVASVSGTLAVANGGTGVTTSTGTGANVLSASPTFTGAPLSTTATNATNTTQIATTAFAYGTLSAAISGYTKLPNGLIIQWGRITTLASSSVTLTFPIAFPTNQYSFVATQTYNATGTGSTDPSAWYWQSGALASVTLYSNVTAPATWIAIGN